MRFELGSLQEFANESITYDMIVDHGVRDPEMLRDFMGSVKPEISPLMSLLTAKGMGTKGLAEYGPSIQGRFRPVSNVHVQYQIPASKVRISHIRANADGYTFSDDNYPTMPGKGKLYFYIYVDDNYASHNDVYLLANGKQLFVVDDPIPSTGGTYEVKVKVDGNNVNDYIDPDYLYDGAELQVVTNKHKADFSYGGSQKLAFAGWGDAFLTLQRFKYSYGGTAQAMLRKGGKTNVYTVKNAATGKEMYLTDMERMMMEQMASSLEFQIREGMGTVDRDTGKVVLTDKDNDVVVSGEGLVYAGDGAMEYPIQEQFTMAWLENFLQDFATHISEDSTGEKSVLALLPTHLYIQANLALAAKGVTQNNNIVGEGGEKFIVDTYKGYELAGYKFYLAEDKMYNKRPGYKFTDGTKSNMYEGLIVPLGKVDSGAGSVNGVELLTLRPMVQGTVAGINESGNIATEIDGSSKHALTQNGIVAVNTIGRIYRPLNKIR